MCFCGLSGRLFGYVAVHDFIFGFIHIQKDVQFLQTGGFGLKLFLLWEGLCNFGLGAFELHPGVGQQLLAVVKPVFQVIQKVIQTQDVAKDIRSQMRGMPSLSVTAYSSTGWPLREVPYRWKVIPSFRPSSAFL